MIVAVHQPQYMPWLGYFDKIASADHFVFLDTVQYKKNEWQNRNRIKTSQGPQWLTVPVTYRFPEKIYEVGINESVPWQKNQRNALKTNYSKSPFYSEIVDLLDDALNSSWDSIARLNTHVVTCICSYLGIQTSLHTASSLESFPEGPDQRLIAITKHFGSTSYLAGAGGKDYMNLEEFDKSGIDVIFQGYDHPQYPQLFEGFESNMSILDLLFNCGPDSLKIIRGTS